VPIGDTGGRRRRCGSTALGAMRLLIKRQSPRGRGSYKETGAKRRTGRGLTLQRLQAAAKPGRLNFLNRGRGVRTTGGRAGGRCEARSRRSRGASRGGGHERRSAHPCALLRCALNIAAPDQAPHRAEGGAPTKSKPHRREGAAHAAAPGPTHRPGVNAAKAADCGQTQAAEFSKHRARRWYHQRACGWALRSEVKEEPRR
jgi:hypothetical protein